MQPFFSVIICTYNRFRLLPRALRSLMVQTEQDFEVVVVDDGSTDRTADVIRSYEPKIRSLKYVKHEKNLGVGAARNSGVQSSIGKFVTFLDSDDEYENDHLSNRKTVLQKYQHVDFLHGGINVVGDPFVVDKDDFSKRIHVSECAVGGTFFIRRDVFDEIGLFKNLSYAEDAEYLERAKLAGILMYETTDATYRYYRNVPGQLTELHRKRCRRQYGLSGWLNELTAAFRYFVKSLHHMLS